MQTIKMRVYQIPYRPAMMEDSCDSEMLGAWVK